MSTRLVYKVRRLHTAIATGFVFLFLAGSSFESAWAASIAQSEDPGAVWFAIGRGAFGDVWSPDHHAAIKGVEDVGLKLLIGKTTTPLRDVHSPLGLVEVIWSPRSNAFIVNSSDGELVGNWHIHLYTLNAQDRPVRRNLEKLIRPLIKSFPLCEEGEYANLAATWVEEGRQLLVLAEVPPHSICRNMGAVTAFLVDAGSWKMVKRISADDLHRDWGAILGPRLR